MSSAKQRVLNNSFIDRLRIEMVLERSEYRSLVEALERLAGELSGKMTVDRDLALVLYSAPQMVRNMFIDASTSGSPISDLADELEEMWIELDALVLECLG